MGDLHRWTKFMTPEGKFKVENYVVAFIDLMGQRAAMGGYLFLPPKTRPEERRDFMDRMEYIINAVHTIQDNFKKAIDISNRWTELETEVPGISKEKLDSIKKYRTSNIVTQQFSDGMVLFTKLADEEHFALKSFSSIIDACATIMMDGLSKRYPFRVGIAVGSATSLSGSDIYGPALMEAYRLENEIANFPRIVISEHIIRWLNGFDARDYEDEDFKKIAIAMKNECLKFFSKDTDGTIFLDYLKPEILEHFDTSDIPISKIKAFIEHQIETHTATNNEKVLLKYSKLLGYILSRTENDQT